MPDLPEVAVVILNWNGRHYLEKFLPSVTGSSYPNLRIVVGDNASTDDSVAFLKDQYPQVRIIQNAENLGFASGYNEVLKQVEADYLVLLNSDVEVTANWIEPLVELMEGDRSIAAAQPKLKAYQRKTHFEYAGAAGGYIDKFGYPFCRGRIFDTLEADTGQYEKAEEIFWASGAALFIKRKCWQEVGGLDPDFFAHMEEIDLCWRLKNLGYKVMYCPDSTVYHVGGGTLQAENAFKTYLNFRNNLAMLLKNLEEHRLFSTIFIRFWLDFISLMKFIAEGKFRHALAINKAHISFFKDYSRNKRKRQAKISAPGAGFYKGSVVFDYFVRSKKTFSQIDSERLAES